MRWNESKAKRISYELKEKVSKRGEYHQKLEVKYVDEVTADQFVQLCRSWGAPHKVISAINDDDVNKFVSLQIIALILSENFGWLGDELGKRLSKLDRVLMIAMINQIDATEHLEVTEKLVEIAVIVESFIFRAFGDEARKLETR